MLELSTGQPLMADPLARARRVADEWQAMRDHHDECVRENAAESLYLHLSPTDLVEMWESQRAPDGKPLTGTQWQGLCAAWLQTFRELPPAVHDEVASDEAAQLEEVEHVETIADDAMLRFRDVIRIAGLSESTIKRRWADADGSFPAPIKISTRRLGWRWSRAL